PHGSTLAGRVVCLLPGSDSILFSHIARMEEIRRQRAQNAASSFRTNPPNWERLRSLHISETAVEAAMVEMAGDDDLGNFLDLGTGTGRILTLCARRAAQYT